MNHRQLTIFPVLNGFIIQAGCQLVAYTDKDKFKADLSAWIDDPSATEKRITEKEGFNGFITGLKRPVETDCNTPPQSEPMQESCTSAFNPSSNTGVLKALKG